MRYRPGNILARGATIPENGAADMSIPINFDAIKVNPQWFTIDDGPHICGWRTFSQSRAQKLFWAQTLVGGGIPEGLSICPKLCGALEQYCLFDGNAAWRPFRRFRRDRSSRPGNSQVFEMLIDEGTPHRDPLPAISSRVISWTTPHLNPSNLCTVPERWDLIRSHEAASDCLWRELTSRKYGHRVGGLYRISERRRARLRCPPGDAETAET